MKYTKLYRHYESDFEKFLKKFKQQHPNIEKMQREARAIWWDKPSLSMEEIDRATIPEVKLKPYVYI